eukprot:gene19803-biopygen28650
MWQGSPQHGSLVCSFKHLVTAEAIECVAAKFKGTFVRLLSMCEDEGAPAECGELRGAQMQGVADAPSTYYGMIVAATQQFGKTTGNSWGSTFGVAQGRMFDQEVLVTYDGFETALDKYWSGAQAGTAEHPPPLVQIVMMYDTGSSLTYLTKEVLETLGYEPSYDILKRDKMFDDKLNGRAMLVGGDFSSTPQRLLPSKVLPEYGAYYSSIQNDESVSAVRAPAGVDLDTKAIREHLQHIAELGGLFLDSEKAKSNASRSLSIQTFMRKQGKDTVQTSIYRGDTLVVTCCSDDLYSITVIPNEKRPRTPLSDEDTLRSLCALRAVQVSKKSQQSKIKNKTYDVDGQFLETRSTKHKNATVAGVARQLHDAKAAVLPRANEEGITAQGDALYEGSFHVWVTLPHDRNVDMTLREYKLLQLQHAYLGHLLQTVEPLLMSLFSGDPRALGDAKNTHNRASMRADTSNWAGYGTTAVKYMARGPDVESITGFQVMWFENESDMLARRGARMQRDDMSKLFVWIDGKKVPFTACIGSNMRNGYYYPNNTWNIPLHKSPGAGTGADIRSRLCDSLDMSLKKGWVPRWLRVRDTLELRFVHGEGTPKVKVSRNAPIDARRWGKELVGIEFRAIDNMPTHQIDNVLHLVVLLGAAAVSQVEKIWHDNANSDPNTQAFFATHTATLSPHWNAALDAVRKQGAHAPLPKAYTTYIASQAGISSLKTRNASATAFGALQDFAKSLHAEYCAHSVTALMHPRSNDEGPPAFSNTNQEAWEAMTVSHLLEAVLAREGAVKGARMNADTFGGENIGAALTQLGLRENGHGNMLMHNGRSGEEAKTRIFVGVNYYGRLKHMVEDKYQSRARGAVDATTRQPTKSKGQSGGLRIGEMEQNALVAHGLASFTREAFMQRSDHHSTKVNATSGTPAEWWAAAREDPEGPDEEATVETPYTFTLMHHELRALGVEAALLTSTDEFYL